MNRRLLVKSSRFKLLLVLQNNKRDAAMHKFKDISLVITGFAIIAICLFVALQTAFDGRPLISILTTLTALAWWKIIGMILTER